jgi:hypothetical protein
VSHTVVTDVEICVLGVTSLMYSIVVELTPDEASVNCYIDSDGSFVFVLRSRASL